jgi:PKD repeat protein
VYDYTPMVQNEIDYTLIKLTDAEAGCDTLIVEMNYYDKPGDAAYLGYWRHVLVHYDNPADEPPIPAPKPVAGFTYVLEGTTVTFTNTSTLATSYSWDFGDGGTSTETDPVHTYAGDGAYTVALTATNANGDNTTSQSIIISTTVLTEDLLVGGPWKVQVTNHAVYVGGGMGADNWWITPLANLDGTNVGTPDDWSCMPDDEFIFSAGGGFEYKTMGSARNDGYMGTPNGCWSDAEIGASPGAAFGSCNTHTFTFTPAAGTTRPIIEVTNGPGFAAFIGFYKGYYGGENTSNTNPPNGGLTTNRYEVIAYTSNDEKETLIVSVDISVLHDGSASWTAELERPAKALTLDILTAGAWHLQTSGHACYVGGAMGSDAWWICPLANLDGTNVGTPDDWSSVHLLRRWWF